MNTSTPSSSNPTGMGTFVGVMNSAKQKWDSSGANEAMSKVSASIPDSTKMYIFVESGMDAETFDMASFAPDESHFCLAEFITPTKVPMPVGFDEDGVDVFI